MSAAFSFHDFTCWATNGTIEAYLSRMAQLATETADTDARLSRWLTEEQARFYPGAVIQLEPVLTEPLLVAQFSCLFGRATAEFLNLEIKAKQRRGLLLPISCTEKESHTREAPLSMASPAL